MNIRDSQADTIVLRLQVARQTLESASYDYAILCDKTNETHLPDVDLEMDKRVNEAIASLTGIIDYLSLGAKYRQDTVLLP